MTRDAMKALVERLHDLWCTGDLSQVPEIYSADFIFHIPAGAIGARGFAGWNGATQAIAGIRSAFSGWTETIEDMVIEGDRVVTRYTSTGTHTGRFLGIEPTGQPVRFSEISIYRLKDGLVAEQWCLTDMLCGLS